MVNETQRVAPMTEGVVLPAPDPDNITVLTNELPNEPILPWHHFDSPWLPDQRLDDDGAAVESVSLHQDDVPQDDVSTEWLPESLG